MSPIASTLKRLRMNKYFYRVVVVWCFEAQLLTKHFVIFINIAETIRRQRCSLRKNQNVFCINNGCWMVWNVSCIRYIFTHTKKIKKQTYKRTKCYVNLHILKNKIKIKCNSNPCTFDSFFAFHSFYTSYYRSLCYKWTRVNLNKKHNRGKRLFKYFI